MGSVGSTLFPRREPLASVSPPSEGGFKIRNQLLGRTISPGGNARPLKASTTATSAGHRISSREGWLRFLYNLKTGVTAVIINGEIKPNDDQKKEQNRNYQPVISSRLQKNCLMLNQLYSKNAQFFSKDVYGKNRARADPCP